MQVRRARRRKRVRVKPSANDFSFRLDGNLKCAPVGNMSAFVAEDGVLLLGRLWHRYYAFASAFAHAFSYSSLFLCRISKRRVSISAWTSA